jgi:hypothetical protein
LWYFDLGIYSADKQEVDISFEELEDNDHFRIQKRQIGGSNADKETEDTQNDAQVNSGTPGSAEAKNPDDVKDTKADEDIKVTRKKALFDSDLVQIDMFSPFPIPLFNSNYLKRSLQRIIFKENKMAYMQSKWLKLCELNLFKKIFVYIFWIVYVMKFQKTDKEEILCELKVALREKMRKLFILIPIPKDKHYELVPIILSLAVEIAINSEVSTVSEKNNVGSPPKNTYDYECKQDLFQTVYYEIIGFLPSSSFIENIILKYTKGENKFDMNANYLKEKKNTKQPILKGIKKNLCNVLNTFCRDQSRNNLMFSSASKNSHSKLLGNAFAANSNIMMPVSSTRTLPVLMSPSRTSRLDFTDEIDVDRPLTKREIEHNLKSVKFDTSTLSPCFDHIYKSYQYSPPHNEVAQRLLSTDLGSTRSMAKTIHTTKITDFKIFSFFAVKT